MKKYLFIVVIVLLFSCKNDDTEVQTFTPKYKFSFNWKGEPINLADLNEIKYINKNGESLSITRLRYLVSNMVLIDMQEIEFPNSQNLETYTLVNIESDNYIEKELNSDNVITPKTYKTLKFTLGFDEVLNANNYVDLNIVNWNWPENLGNGYHVMQYEGLFVDVNSENKVYQYHMGTRKNTNGNFEQNHRVITLPLNTEITKNSIIEIKMDVSEWFKNPNTWNLNVFGPMLMPNYEAQVMMHQNSNTVFSVVVN